MKQEINLNRNAEIRFLLDFPILTPKIARKCSEKNELGTQEFKNSKRYLEKLMKGEILLQREGERVEDEVEKKADI